MTYEVKRGPFAIGTINSGRDIPSLQEVTLELDEIRTSEGVVNGNLNIKNGLAFSDMYVYDTGGGSPNLMAAASHSPKNTGGFGCDYTPGYSNAGCGSTVGCAIYSNDNMNIIYRDRLDQNHSVDSSLLVIF